MLNINNIYKIIKNKNLILIYHLASSTLKKRLIRHFELLEKVQTNNLLLESSQVHLILL